MTLCVWQNLDTPNAALESMKSSETIRTAAKVMVDSFITFQDKVMLVEGVQVSGSLQQTSVAPLQKKNVRFNGSLINVSMIKSMNGLKGMLTTRARASCWRSSRIVSASMYSRARTTSCAC